MQNSTKVMRPLPSRSSALRQPPSREPHRELSDFLKPSTVTSPARYAFTSSTLFFHSALSLASNSCRQAVAPPDFGACFSSSTPSRSSMNSIFAFDMMPVSSDVYNRLVASTSKSSSVMPFLSLPRSMLNSFLLSMSSPIFSKHAATSGSSMRPLPFVSRPFRQAVNMSPYFFIKCNLNVPIACPATGSISMSDTKPLRSTSICFHNN
mmetsp:Transcript_47687/g.83960  ORF Transcript_47687/g.83960 Transcript_47687/m.83960 type:complete len:208 (-) Transcript_47687:679-1302(-)